MELASMEFFLAIVKAMFLFMLLTWVLIHTLKPKRENNDNVIVQELREIKSSSLTIFSKITFVSNILVSISYLVFCLYEFLRIQTVPYDSVILTMTWSLVSVVAVLSPKRTRGDPKSWPKVLILWWLFWGFLDLVLVSFTVIKHFKIYDLPRYLPTANILDIILCPLTLLLCFNALLPVDYMRKHNELEQPLIHKDAETGWFDPFPKAGIWSQITFMWLNPLFKLGRAQKLEFSHIPPIPQSERAYEALRLLEESLQKQKTQSCLLPNAILHAVKKPLAINAVYAGVNTITSYIGPLLITHFVNFLSGNRDRSSFHQGLIIAFVFFFAKTVESLSQRQWYFGAQRIGIRIRAALMVLVYRKSLSIKYGGTSNGTIVNLLNVDVEKVGDFFFHIHGIWLLPVQVIFALIILYKNLGLGPSMAALFSTIMIVLGNTPLANKQKNLHTRIMEAKDSRIKATSEILKNMKFLKLHSWESSFMNKILQQREIERNWLKKYLYTCSTVAFLFWVSPTFVSVFTFGVCIILGTPLTPGTVLSALATFRILQEPIYNLPDLISMIAQTKVSLDRIQNIVKEQDRNRFIHHPPTEASDIAVEIEPGEYSWDSSDSDMKKPTLRITKKMNILKGYKVAICGSVGSGKSSLLCSIFGEIPKTSGGHIHVYGSKAFVPQSAWIQSGSVRENVLFGREMSGGLYEQVVSGCALDCDMKAWSDGDLSVVGERGLNLSGGQKQRIQLARALYNDSDVYFLDDPFSAVDAHTGAHIFKNCLVKLLHEKTVLYVTHQLEFLSAADLVLVMKDGRIVQSGKFEELIGDPSGELSRQITAHSKSLDQVNPTPQQDYPTAPTNQSFNSLVKEEEPENRDDIVSGNVPQEETEFGRVKFSVYSTFITSAYKGALVPIILICQILFQALQIGSNYWIVWGAQEESLVSRQKLIGVFLLLSGGSSFFILGRAFLLSKIAIETAQGLFLAMTKSVFRAPLSFFDSTPSSRILNRTSTDQSTVDTDIPYRLAGLVFALIQLLGIVFLMSHVAVQIFFLFLVVFAISVWYQAYYISTARELARMVGTHKSPVQHHFSESISGASTIRCFNQEERFLKKNLNLIDAYSRVAFYNNATMEWLCVRINFLFNLVFFLLLIILVNLPRSSINPSLAGLAASYGLNLNVLQAWVIWNLCNVENKMISVERILQYTNIPSEAALVIDNSRPGPLWPIHGEIELDNLHVRYNPSLPTILKGITCTFPGKKKIGVVGRTGSGKSTLIQALFRVVEPTKGCICIDGVDILKIGLQDLRSRLSIIPQDPTLFQGTVRTNLDPLQEHSDQEIWEVLNKCQLSEIVRQDQKLLEAQVAEDGENWSVGQRQLVCLARVLLQKRKILVLDEATASVDTATDNLIQKTIRQETSMCTVITIAHRIPTVIDNDLVLVLDGGRVLEYDSPDRLQRDSSSAFSKLCMICHQQVLECGLSLDVEKTSEDDLLKAIFQAKLPIEHLGFHLSDYTSYADTSSIPGHYVLFWELIKKKGGGGKVEVDPVVMEECCSKVEEMLHLWYRRFRVKEKSIGPLEIRVVKQGTFDQLMDFHVAKGTSVNQYKTARCVMNEEAIGILDSGVVGKYFSNKLPSLEPFQILAPSSE